MNEHKKRKPNLTDEDFARFQRILERRGRTAERAIAAPIGAAPVQHTSTGILLRSTMPEARCQDNLGIFLKGFRTWTCSNRFNTALDFETAVYTSETPRDEPERLHSNKLVAELFLA